VLLQPTEVVLFSIVAFKTHFTSV